LQITVFVILNEGKDLNLPGTMDASLRPE